MILFKLCKHNGRKLILNFCQTMKRQSFVSIIGLKQVFKFGHFRNKTTSKSVSKASQSVSKAKGKKSHHFRSVTSGSEVSVVGRHEHTINGLHRNSSSGLVFASDSCFSQIKDIWLLLDMYRVLNVVMIQMLALVHLPTVVTAQWVAIVTTNYMPS